MTDWMDLSKRAALQSHRLIGWIYWDPVAIANLDARGIPNGAGYYVSSRGAPLGPAGAQAIAAAFYSINPVFIEMAHNITVEHGSYADATVARDEAVSLGLREYVPEIVDQLAAMGAALWAAADGLSLSGRVLFAAHRDAPRRDDPLLSAWLAVNCIREWRGDTHWALLIAHDLSGVEAGVLHDAHLDYGGWIAGSRGADDDAIVASIAGLESKGLATAGKVNQAGLDLRQRIEDRTDELCQAAWRLLGEDTTKAFIDMMEPAGEVLMRRIDDTAGSDWMPAGREPRRAI